MKSVKGFAPGSGRTSGPAASIPGPSNVKAWIAASVSPTARPSASCVAGAAPGRMRSRFSPSTHPSSAWAGRASRSRASTGATGTRPATSPSRSVSSPQAAESRT